MAMLRGVLVLVVLVATTTTISVLSAPTKLPTTIRASQLDLCEYNYNTTAFRCFDPDMEEPTCKYTATQLCTCPAGCRCEVMHADQAVCSFECILNAREARRNREYNENMERY